MNAPTLVRPLRLQRAWYAQLLDRAADGAAALSQAVGAAWQRWREARQARAAHDAALDLDEGTLRDMGAPLWLQEQARTRRENRRFERELDRVQAGMGVRRSYY